MSADEVDAAQKVVQEMCLQSPEVYEVFLLHAGVYQGLKCVDVGLISKF